MTPPREGGEVTEEVTAKVPEQTLKGLNIDLSLILRGEAGWLEVNRGGTWLAPALRPEGGQKNCT